VFYRSIQAGQVVSYDLDEDGQGVSIQVFVSAPYERLVLTNTRFWNASGLDLKLTPEGIQLDTGSLLSIIIGGVAFDNIRSLEDEGGPARDNDTFPLYGNQAQASEITYSKKVNYLLYFDGSVHGLEIGAPVMVRGIRIGKVLDIRLDFDVDNRNFQIPVLIELEPERIDEVQDIQNLEKEDMMAELVANGLRGQLKSTSLLTGKLYVDLDFHPTALPARLGQRGDLTVLPTVRAPLDPNQQGQRLNGQIRGPAGLEEIGNDLRDAIKGAKGFLTSAGLTNALTEMDGALKQFRLTASKMDEQTLPKLGEAVEQVRATFKSAQGVIAPDTALYHDIKRALTELSAAARSIRDMADYLERHPEALIKGKGAR
jgi:paraquat-inducible protein B